MGSYKTSARGKAGASFFNVLGLHRMPWQVSLTCAPLSFYRLNRFWVAIEVYCFISRGLCLYVFD